jgi:hypothetical protein
MVLIVSQLPSQIQFLLIISRTRKDSLQLPPPLMASLHHILIHHADKECSDPGSGHVSSRSLWLYFTMGLGQEKEGHWRKTLAVLELPGLSILDLCKAGRHQTYSISFTFKYHNGYRSEWTHIFQLVLACERQHSGRVQRKCSDDIIVKSIDNTDTIQLQSRSQCNCNRFAIESQSIQLNRNADVIQLNS